MKSLVRLLCVTAFVLPLSLNPAEAESILFERTDTNNMTASAGGSYSNALDSVDVSDADPQVDNAFAISGLNWSPGSANGSATILAAAQARCMTASSGTTYTPNGFASTQFNMQASGEQLDSSVSAFATMNSQFVLLPSVDPGIDKVVISGIIQLNQVKSGDYWPMHYHWGQGRIHDVTVSLDFMEDYGGTVSVTAGNSLVWSEETTGNESYSFIVERTVSPETYVAMYSRSLCTEWFAFYGPKSNAVMGAVDFACSMSATGYDTSVDSLPVEETRIYKQLIVDNEEEQEPPVLIYPVEE